MIPLLESHPDLAAQLVDPELARALSAGSGKEAQWRCEKDSRHVWEAKVYSRKAGTGCPICAGKRVEPGLNDLATTYPDLAAQLVDPVVGTLITAGSHTKVQWCCPKGHIWEAKPANLVLGRGCPVCSNRKVATGINDIATTHPELAAQMVDQALATKVAAGSTKIVSWWCSEDPRHVWDTRLVDRSKYGNCCPICSGHRVQIGVNDLATTHPEVAEQLDQRELGRELSAGSDRMVMWQCKIASEHRWTASVANRVAGNGCAICSNQIVQAGVNDLATTHPGLAMQLVDPAEAAQVTAGSHRVLRWQCSANAAHRWQAACFHRTGVAPTGCPSCFGPMPSQAEDGLADVVERLVRPLQVLRSQRGMLGDGTELDIVVPDKGLAVEFNGLYWHSSEAGRACDYHAKKSAAGRAHGLQVVHVWEDSWRDRPELVVRMLAHKLGVTHQLHKVLPDADPKIAEQVDAQFLVTGEADAIQSNVFLTANHLKGAVSLTRSFVLRDDHGATRALLGLHSPANEASAQIRHGEWEIQRYATIGEVPGGFSRLLGHAERTFRAEGSDLRSWVAYAPEDVADGGLYEAAGFVAEGELKPDHTYAGNATAWTRMPKETYGRERFRADPRLKWDESWTEDQAVAENGLLHIFDAGKTRWAKPLT